MGTELKTTVTLRDNSAHELIATILPNNVTFAMMTGMCVSKEDAIQFAYKLLAGCGVTP